jgi:L-alanine-DL-glutamate epimerase-like enolase superfamily enzyme
MIISKIEVWNFRPSFRDGPYAMSHVTQDVINGRILQVHTADGRRGLGEIIFPPSLPEDEQRCLIVEEQSYLAGLAGKEIRALVNLAEELRNRGRPWGGVAFGLETVFYDLLGQAQRRSITDLLGGALSDAVDDYFSISERSVGKIRERMEIAGPERKVIQLKLGIGSLDDDAEQITAILNTMTDNQTLLADANGGWTVDAACEIISRFDDPRIIWEEASSIYGENTEIARRSGRPVMVDQCVSEISVAKQAIEEGFASSLCIKPAFLSGLTVARDVRDYCVEGGMRMRIDGTWCGDIATAAILHLAVGAPPDLLIAGCDLREPLVLEPDLKGVVSMGASRIGPPPGPGLGITLSVGTLGAAEATY